MQVYFNVGPQDIGRKLGPFLRGQGVSATLLRQLKYQDKGLLVDEVPAHTNFLLRQGQRVAITLAADAPPLALPQEIPLQAVYKSAHTLVVDKPAGLVMHPVRSHTEGTLANAFAHFVRGSSPVTFRPVGRLDADTSGLVLCAMNAYAAPLLAKSLEKEYLALVGGKLEEHGAIEAPLGPLVGSTVAQCVCPKGKPSRTDYKVLCSTDAWSLLWVRPRTGRTHQIRVHMAHIGHPLLGDSQYGGKLDFLHRHALHCAALSFCEPQAGRVRLSVPLPLDMLAVLKGAKIRGIEQNFLACQTFDTIV